MEETDVPDIVPGETLNSFWTIDEPECSEGGACLWWAESSSGTQFQIENTDEGLVVITEVYFDCRHPETDEVLHQVSIDRRVQHLYLWDDMVFEEGRLTSMGGGGIENDTVRAEALQDPLCGLDGYHSDQPNRTHLSVSLVRAD